MKKLILITCLFSVPATSVPATFGIGRSDFSGSMISRFEDSLHDDIVGRYLTKEEIDSIKNWSVLYLSSYETRLVNQMLDDVQGFVNYPSVGPFSEFIIKKIRRIKSLVKGKHLPNAGDLLTFVRRISSTLTIDKRILSIKIILERDLPSLIEAKDVKSMYYKTQVVRAFLNGSIYRTLMNDTDKATVLMMFDQLAETINSKTTKSCQKIFKL